MSSSQTPSNVLASPPFGTAQQVAPPSVVPVTRSVRGTRKTSGAGFPPSPKASPAKGKKVSKSSAARETSSNEGKVAAPLSAEALANASSVLFGQDDDDLSGDEFDQEDYAEFLQTEEGAALVAQSGKHMDLKMRRKMRKMTREKMKRFKLNQKFDQLCRMLQLSGTTRVEKLTILTEAIKQVEDLRDENLELKQSHAHLKHKVETHPSRRRGGDTPVLPVFPVPPMPLASKVAQVAKPKAAPKLRQAPKNKKAPEPKPTAPPAQSEQPASLMSPAPPAKKLQSAAWTSWEDDLEKERTTAAGDLEMDLEMETDIELHLHGEQGTVKTNPAFAHLESFQNYGSQLNDLEDSTADGDDDMMFVH